MLKHAHACIGRPMLGLPLGNQQVIVQEVSPDSPQSSQCEGYMPVGAGDEYGPPGPPGPPQNPHLGPGLHPLGVWRMLQLFAPMMCCVRPSDGQPSPGMEGR